MEKSEKLARGAGAASEARAGSAGQARGAWGAERGPQKYLAVLGRQPLISLAELESLYGGAVRRVAPSLAEFTSRKQPQIARLGGILKIAEPITQPLAQFLGTLPATGKITLGVSDYSRGATARTANSAAMKCKKILAKTGRSVRIVPNKTAVLSSATSLHNHLFRENKLELIKLGENFFRVLALSNIEQYARRDQARPARDARVGMLPPKLAQILINLAGDLPAGARVLDPFCGTGVVLQEAALDGFRPYGTDKNPRMVEYSAKNLAWLAQQKWQRSKHDRNGGGTADAAGQIQAGRVDGAHAASAAPVPTLAEGDATTYQWQAPIDAVVSEIYLGPPMSNPPAEIKLRSVKEECKALVLAFLKNLEPQIAAGTPVVLAIPAWLRPDGHYTRLGIDEIKKLRYNVGSFKNLGPDDLLYYREGQVVAREIIVLRKK